MKGYLISIATVESGAHRPASSPSAPDHSSPPVSSAYTPVSFPLRAGTALELQPNHFLSVQEHPPSLVHGLFNKGPEGLALGKFCLTQQTAATFSLAIEAEENEAFHLKIKFLT